MNQERKTTTNNKMFYSTILDSKIALQKSISSVFVHYNIRDIITMPFKRTYICPISYHPIRAENSTHRHKKHTLNKHTKIYKTNTLEKQQTCLMLTLSTFEMTTGCSIYSSGRTHLAILSFCFLASTSLPCGSLQGQNNANTCAGM